MSKERTLSRDVGATAIPSGASIILSAGARVTITQTLGGTFTVSGMHGLARIDGKDADALGEKAPGDAPPAAAAAAHAGGPPDEEELWEQLRMVFDPEIPVNIVDLGLIYSLEVKPLEKGGYGVTVDMTLTAPGCGMGPVIAEDARGRLLAVPGVSYAEVRLVWEPPWNQSMISEEGRMRLGLL